MKYFLIFGALCCFLSSCVNTKYIYRSNRLYSLNVTFPAGAPPPPPAGTVPTLSQNLVTYSPAAGFKASITEKADGLIITPQGAAPSVGSTTAIPTYSIQGFKAENLGKIYFPETTLDVSATGIPSYTKLKYFDSKPVLQALSVPLRIRPKLNSSALADSFPQQAETSVNVGIAAGWKFTHNVYSATQGLFGQTTNHYSLSPGYFIGLGATDLKKTNTRGPKIPFERKAAMFTNGFYLMLGINTINIGGAIGWDHVLGSYDERQSWVYQNKTWYGLIVALDILK
ncbi:hypothetical protein [Hymenobacter negativus]|uniref:Uncharacterized protein n=1 Tax=Hymenobacter negativus TaxID=2795026 RepID=A0ABS3QAT2_9BACT|nr:hypothetical protein [Hymenobacter negativus]MBO2008342.1 hypothetical protein [Hymenobacter negativus]